MEESPLTHVEDTGAETASGVSAPVDTPSGPGLGESVLSNLLEVLGTLLTTTQRLIEDFGGVFLISLFTLALAWMFASFSRGFTAKVLRAIGVDLAAERFGLREYLRQRDIHTPPSRALGWVLYIAILYTAFIVAFEVLGLDAAGALLRSIAGYLPHVLVAALLIILGLVIGRWADAIVSRLARVSGLPGHRLLGSGARIAVFLLAVVFAINSLGWISPTILLGGLGIILGAGLATIVLFAFCARQLAESILARGFISALVRPGEQIKVGEIEGILLSVEPASVRIDCGDRIVILPSRLLANGMIEIRKAKLTSPQI